MQDPVSIASLIVGAIGVILAVVTNHEKARRERQIQDQLQAFAGDIDQICHGPSWANRHFEAIEDIALKLDRSEDINEILKHVRQGASDSVAAERTLRNFLNGFLAFQHSMFGTRVAWHIDQPKHDESDR